MMNRNESAFEVQLLAEIQVGDLVNGSKAVKIIDDPFVPNQIDVFLDDYEVDDFGDKIQKCVRIRKQNVNS